ncbi:HAD family hydrolase [Legionella saoudiensis]|uniref:HAD family hydrolase n=1 Tax=Legionella saoudiensis TaxID=1750561 RepID=UPI00073025A2|nr:HAD-IB family hydrolase [Legionella saoudiensis]
MDKEVLALFDFDGTLTTGLPSRLLFLNYLAGLPKMLSSLMSSIAYSSRKQSGGECINWHHYLDALILKGRDRQELNEQAMQFIEQVLIKKLRKEAIERLNFHQQQGHRCILISGAWDIYLEPLAKQYEFQQVICTELEFDATSNKSTGRMRNNYCTGQQKVAEFKKRYAARENYELYAYGDSVHDMALLNYADHAFYRCFK